MAEVEREKPNLPDFEDEPDYGDPPEREWRWPPWLIVLVTVYFTLVYAVGGWLLDFTAWVLAIVAFLFLCYGIFAFFRWAFYPVVRR